MWRQIFMTTHIHTYMSPESLRLLRKPLNNLEACDYLHIHSVESETDCSKFNPTSLIWGKLVAHWRSISFVHVQAWECYCNDFHHFKNLVIFSSPSTEGSQTSVALGQFLVCLQNPTWKTQTLNKYNICPGPNVLDSS